MLHILFTMGEDIIFVLSIVKRTYGITFEFHNDVGIYFHHWVPYLIKNAQLQALFNRQSLWRIHLKQALQHLEERFIYISELFVQSIIILSTRLELLHIAFHIIVIYEGHFCLRKWSHSLYYLFELVIFFYYEIITIFILSHL